MEVCLQRGSNALLLFDDLTGALEGRTRVPVSVNHQEADRAPLFMAEFALERLIRPSAPSRLLSPMCPLRAATSGKPTFSPYGSLVRR